MPEQTSVIWSNLKMHTDLWTGNITITKNLFLTYQNLISATLRFAVNTELAQCTLIFKVNGNNVTERTFDFGGTWYADVDIGAYINVGTNTFEFFIGKTPTQGWGDVYVTASLILSAEVVIPTIQTEYLLLGGVALVLGLIIMRRPKKAQAPIIVVGGK